MSFKFTSTARHSEHTCHLNIKAIARHLMGTPRTPAVPGRSQSNNGHLVGTPKTPEVIGRGQAHNGYTMGTPRTPAVPGRSKTQNGHTVGTPRTPAIPGRGQAHNGHTVGTPEPQQFQAEARHTIDILWAHLGSQHSKSKNRSSRSARVLK